MSATAEALGRRASVMLAELAAISAAPDKIVRLFLTPEHRRAADLVAGWMAAAGLAVGEDALATVRGTLPAGRQGRGRTLLVGSHIDTVIDAGRFDGCLGVVAGILAVEELRRRGVALPFDLAVLAFGDEEGVRFPTTLAGSSAIAGIFDPLDLQARDGAGTTLAEALAAYGRDVRAIPAAAMRREDTVGYLEVHIEQGPVLEAEGLALGVVTAIAGATRAQIRIRGMAGHAGTVPMAMRRDAVTAAAELVLAIEAIARAGTADALVATVGRIEARPGAINVVAGAVEMTLDLRAAADAPRHAAFVAIEAAAAEIAARRGVGIEIVPTHDRGTAPCAERLQAVIGNAVARLGLPVRRLMSGAGHDGHAMAALCDVGMIFVRCRGGISHNPAEFASALDIGLAIEALVLAVAGLAEEEGTAP